MSLYWPDHPFRSERRRERRRLARWRGAEKAATQTLLLSHGNCLDGVTAAIVTTRALGKEGLGIAYAQPNQVKEFLAWLAAQGSGSGRTLMVADLSLQKPDLDAIVDAVGTLRRSGWSIQWREDRKSTRLNSSHRL